MSNPDIITSSQNLKFGYGLYYLNINVELNKLQ